MSLILDRLYHLHWVTPDVARSAQPYLGFYSRFLAPHGFKSLINLRGENADFRWWTTEKRVTAALKIRHFDVKLSSRNIPSRSGLAALFDAFAAAERPLLLKCSGGQDRTGLAAALYLLQLKGPGALAEAKTQLHAWPYLHFPKRQQVWLRYFPGYANEHAGAALKEWGRVGYDPNHFAEWLAAKGLKGSYRSFQAEATT
jgi:protein-tyrosine phosphatase family protein